MAGEWKKFASVRAGKDGSKYIKVDQDITLKVGDIVQIQDPRKKLKDSVKAGRLSEGKAEEFAAKIPDYILSELVLPPPKN